MGWDPDVYLKYANERTRPAADLLARVPIDAPARVVDLGCGPGNSTALLAARWPGAAIEGVESSPDMLAKAHASGIRATWTAADIDAWHPAARYDVVFSNAALHWLPEHRTLIPRLMRAVSVGGALAFQMPNNFEAPSHVLMREVAASGSWAPKVEDARTVHVQSAATYFDILAPLSSSLDIWETTYLHVLEGEDPVLAWVSGTGLRPFVGRLDDREREAFLLAYRQRLRAAYPRRADGKTLLPFTRLFVVARP